VADRVPDHRRTQGLAVFGISGLAPIGLGTTLGDVILGFAGYERLFLVAAVFSLVSFLMTFTLDSNNSRGGEAPPGGFTTVLRRRDLRPIWVATGALSLSFSVAFVFVATFVERQGLGVVSPFFVAYAGVAVLLRLGLGSLPDRVGPHRMVMPSLLAYAAGFATLAIVPSLTGLVVAGALGGVGHGFSFPVLLGLATGRAGPVDRASATAVFTALLDAGSFVFAPALGWVIAGWGYPAGFGGAIGGIVLILAVFSLLERRRG
jgi:predicted MFS family arabinose efflux permease